MYTHNEQIKPVTKICIYRLLHVTLFVPLVYLLTKSNTFQEFIPCMYVYIYIYIYILQIIYIILSITTVLLSAQNK